MDRLEYVLTIIEEKNITRAAKRLYITQPTLTKYINQLEEEYGVKLFDRTASPIRLTEAGQLYVQKKMAMTEEERSLRTRLKELAAKKITLTIGSERSRGERFLPAARYRPPCHIPASLPNHCRYFKRKRCHHPRTFHRIQYCFHGNAFQI